MSWHDECESVCPVDWTLTVIGDRWVLLIMRELTLGVHRFDAIQAQTGMSSHLLSGRLRALEAHGLVERRLYESRPQRYEYHKTDKGREIDPVIMLLRSFGRKWRGDPAIGEPAVEVRDKKTGKLINSISQIPVAAEDFRFTQVKAKIGPSFQAEREAKAKAFKESRAQIDSAKRPKRSRAAARLRKNTPSPGNRV